MKQKLFLICLALFLIVAIAGCSNQPKTTSGLDGIMAFSSYEEVVEAKRVANLKDDPYDLKGLDYYYVPAYAETRWQFNRGSLSNMRFETGYDSAESPWFEGKPSGFLFSMTRTDGYELLEHMINPPIPYASSPISLKEVEGVYYTDLSLFQSPPHDGTQFYWLHEGHLIFMRIDKALMDKIRANDPGALEGPLFELQKVELE